MFFYREIEDLLMHEIFRVSAIHAFIVVKCLLDRVNTILLVFLQQRPLCILNLIMLKL